MNCEFIDDELFIFVNIICEESVQPRVFKDR